MIIKNKMSAVLAACVFMLGASNTFANDALSKVNTNVDVKGDVTVDDVDAEKYAAAAKYVRDLFRNDAVPNRQADYTNEEMLDDVNVMFLDNNQKLSNRVYEANEKSLLAIQKRVGEILSSLKKEFPSIEIPDITQSSTVGDMCDAIQKVAKAALEKKSDKLVGTSQYQVIQRQIDTLMMFANISKNINYLDIYVHADNISKLLIDFPNLTLKYEPKVFGQDGMLAFVTNTLNDSELSKDRMLELVNKVLAFTKGLDEIKKARVASSIKFFNALRLALVSFNQTAADSSNAKDQDLEKIKDIFKGVRNDCELSNYFTKATSKALNESFSATSKRIIKQLDKMHKVFSKEVNNNAENPLAYRLSDIEELRQEIADFSIRDDNSDTQAELTMPDMVAAMRRFVYLCETADDFINALHSELSVYQLEKVGSMVIGYDKLAQIFIKKAGKFFDAYSTEKINRKYMRETIYSAFREQADNRGFILGSNISPEFVANILSKIEVTVEDQVAISGMYHRLLRYISESNMSKTDKAKTFAKTAIYKILSPIDKLCYKIRTKTANSNIKEKFADGARKVKAQFDKAGTKIKNTYGKITGKKKQESVEVDPDAILNGFVLKPYKEYSLPETYRLIKLLENVPEKDRDDVFAKVEKYTGRKVVPIKHKKTERFKQWWNSKTRKEDPKNIYILDK